MTKNIKNKIVKMDSFGDLIKLQREEKKLPLRTVAAYLDLDQAVLSKIERGQRKASRAHVEKLASYFQLDFDDLLVAWLSDKLVYEVADEIIATRALKMAEKKVRYRTEVSQRRVDTINLIKNALTEDNRVIAAWLFGSVARGDDNPSSDVDLMVELTNAKHSLFDLIDLESKIEKIIKRKVDLVERGNLNEFAFKTAKEDLIKIYG